MKRGRTRVSKKGIAIETLAYWLIAIGILVLMAASYFILAKKGDAGISIIDRIFRRG